MLLFWKIPIVRGDIILSIPFGMLQIWSVSATSMPTNVFQSLLGCFIRVRELCRSWGMWLSIPFGMLRSRQTGRSKRSILAFNPFWDASLKETYADSKNNYLLSIPFGMLLIINLRIRMVPWVTFQSLLGCFLISRSIRCLRTLCSFNPFWDASLMA